MLDSGCDHEQDGSLVLRLKWDLSLFEVLQSCLEDSAWDGDIILAFQPQADMWTKDSETLHLLMLRSG
jgi:hypothetical protein